MNGKRATHDSNPNTAPRGILTDNNERVLEVTALAIFGRIPCTEVRVKPRNQHDDGYRWIPPRLLTLAPRADNRAAPFLATLQELTHAYGAYYLSADKDRTDPEALRFNKPYKPLSRRAWLRHSTTNPHDGLEREPHHANLLPH